MTPSDPLFWTALLKIIGIDIILAGDNAVVIALAARSLPPKQQKLAVIWGCAAAVVIRVILTVFAATMLNTPWLRLIGGLLLFWIGIKLLVPQHDGGPHVTEADNLGAAIKTIVMADVVMSLDNIIGVAGAAGDSKLLLGLGLAISIPLVVFASAFILKLMERFPVVITLGAALLGWVAAEMIITDPVAKDWFAAQGKWLLYSAPVAGALLVVAAGKWIAQRKQIQSAPEQS
ncbi:MAG: TerC family protein [Betaproteobacteria bacterium]|nr:TerC family protein [Betaproteobacteria bacterium]